MRIHWLERLRPKPKKGQPDNVEDTAGAELPNYRFICSSWKQPVFLDFNTAVSSEILMALIRVLEDMGYPARAIVSDMVSKNAELWRELGIFYDGETRIANPAHPERYVLSAHAILYAWCIFRV